MNNRDNGGRGSGMSRRDFLRYSLSAGVVVWAGSADGAEQAGQSALRVHRLRDARL